MMWEKFGYDRLTSQSHRLRLKGDRWLSPYSDYVPVRVSKFAIFLEVVQIYKFAKLTLYRLWSGKMIEKYFVWWASEICIKAYHITYERQNGNTWVLQHQLQFAGPVLTRVNKMFCILRKTPVSIQKINLSLLHQSACPTTQTGYVS